MGRIATGKPVGRPKRIVEEHSIPLVREILQLVRPYKDLAILTEAELADSFLSVLRHRPNADPGIGKISRIANAIGYELVLRPKINGGKFK